jgi:23S rRNA (cytosine1962-C5)-methyltransferase
MPPSVQELPLLTLLSSPDWKDYELLDSGSGARLERFGQYILARPDPEALWQPALPEVKWKNAHAIFQVSTEENGGHWVYSQKLPARWPMEYKGLKFWVQTTASKQVGVFPEQASQWDWIERQVKTARYPIKVLNLFGYTGIASLAAARAGALVTHLDASRKVVSWANENQQLSGLEDRPIRWIIEDAVKFVQREARRGSKYEGLILDPPKFGRGPKGEVWEFYKLIPALMQSCRAILSDQPQFILLTAYAVKASALTLYYSFQEMMEKKGGNIIIGEVVLLEKSAGRALSTAIFGRWSAGSSQI